MLSKNYLRGSRNMIPKRVRPFLIALMILGTNQYSNAIDGFSASLLGSGSLFLSGAAFYAANNKIPLAPWLIGANFAALGIGSFLASHGSKCHADKKGSSKEALMTIAGFVSAGMALYAYGKQPKPELFYAILPVTIGLVAGIAIEEE